MTFTAEQLSQLLPGNGKRVPNNAKQLGRVCWVAYSGGLDSTVLLHALAQLNLPTSLRALHVNHQISPNATIWQEHCEAVCRQWNIPLVVEKVVVKNSGKGIEDAAREVRHNAFGKHLAANDFLLTAHHANDQAETLLLRLLRGAGPAGLSAMAKERQFGDGVLYRPLLSFTREELEAYATENNLAWINDESNNDDHYDRNFLRNQIMPLLQQRWPALMRQLQRTADVCTQQAELIEGLAQKDMALVSERNERIGQSIDLTEFGKLSSARQKNLLRYWLQEKNYDLPQHIHWQQLEQQLFRVADETHPEVRWGNVCLRSFQQRLFVLPSKLPEFKFTLVPSTEKLRLRLNVSPEQLQIRVRQGGERCKPAGRMHSQSLKKLLQEYELEPWLRNQVPLIYCSDELVAVGDLWICEGFVAQENEAGYELMWRSETSKI